MVWSSKYLRTDCKILCVISLDERREFLSWNHVRRRGGNIHDDCGLPGAVGTKILGRCGRINFLRALCRGRGKELTDFEVTLWANFFFQLKSLVRKNELRSRRELVTLFCGLYRDRFVTTNLTPTSPPRQYSCLSGCVVGISTQYDWTLLIVKHDGINWKVVFWAFGGTLQAYSEVPGM